MLTHVSGLATLRVSRLLLTEQQLNRLNRQALYQRMRLKSSSSSTYSQLYVHSVANIILVGDKNRDFVLCGCLGGVAEKYM